MDTPNHDRDPKHPVLRILVELHRALRGQQAELLFWHGDDGAEAVAFGRRLLAARPGGRVHTAPISVLRRQRGGRLPSIEEVVRELLACRERDPPEGDDPADEGALVPLRSTTPKKEEIPMNVQKIPVRGTSQTVGNTPTRAIAMPLLPVDGAFSISGTVLAVDDAPTRASVAFYPRFGGSMAAGKAAENDTGAPAADPQDGGAAQAWAPGAPKPTITGQQLEILLTGIDGKTVHWAWDLEIVLLSLPASASVAQPPAGTATTKSPSGPQTTTKHGGGAT